MQLPRNQKCYSDMLTACISFLYASFWFMNCRAQIAGKYYSYNFIACRKWTKELDDAISELQRHMEEECDKYFEAIKPKAIKVS